MGEAPGRVGVDRTDDAGTGNPVRYASEHEVFEHRRTALNQVFIFATHANCVGFPRRAQGRQLYRVEFRHAASGTWPIQGLSICHRRATDSPMVRPNEFAWSAN
jgi:hypothetical protein